MSLSSVRSETALRSRLFSSSRSFRRFTCSVFSPPNSWRHRSYVTSLTPIWRIASTMFWPCETRTSTCRSFATISSGLYRFLAIAVLLDVKDIPQVGRLQWGWISPTGRPLELRRPRSAALTDRGSPTSPSSSFALCRELMPTANSSASKEVVTAALLVIGSKILSGRTKDQNIGYVAEYLTAVGIDLKEVRVVG